MIKFTLLDGRSLTVSHVDTVRTPISGEYIDTAKSVITVNNNTYAIKEDVSTVESYM